MVFPQTFDSVKAEFAEWREPCPLNEVKCKTYIVHGSKDKDPLAAAELAKAQIPNSELHIIQDGWHILDLHPEYDSILEGQLQFGHNCMGTILPPKPAIVIAATPQPQAIGSTSYTQMVN